MNTTHILLLFALVLIVAQSSGCLTLHPKSTYIYNTYKLNTKLTEISTILPDKTHLPSNVSMTITYPSGINKGIYRIYTTTRDVTFYPKNHTLYQTGIYTVKYETNDIIKYDYFFVGSIDQRLVFYPTTYTLNNSFVSIRIVNDGKIDGFLYITLFTNEPFSEGSKTAYGHSFINTIDFIKNGHYYEYERYLGVERTFLLVNGDVYGNN